MSQIYVKSLSSAQAEACYSAFLTGQLPKDGCLITEGSHVYLLDALPILPEGQGVPVNFGPVDWIHSLLSSQMKSVTAYREFLLGRRLPAGVALAASPEGIVVFPSASYEPDLGTMSMFQLSFDPLEEVVTPQEASKLYHVDAKRIQWDCEHAGESADSIFSLKEVRHSGNTWLLLKSAAAHIYHEEPPVSFAINPLLLVFSTVEAAAIWNRDSGVVRSAAGGAGHAAARMMEGDRRKSGRIWLVRREAMNRLFGQAMPERMYAAIKHLENA